MKALILGTNAGQADIISYLKQKGWEVHACGYRQEGPGCDLADEFHLADTLDVGAVKELTKDIKPDIIYSVSSDSAIKTVTKVAEALGLPHFLNSELIDLFDHKEKSRLFLNDNEISKVGFMTLADLSELNRWTIFPCVVKPSDSQGQRGVCLVEQKEDLEDAVKNAIEKSVTRTVIIEEYLQGVEFSTNVIVQNHEVIVNEFTERFIHGKSYFGLPKGHGIPVRNIGQTEIATAAKMVEKMIQKLNIKDAVLYVQMVATEKGPRIIEVAPRLDGCHIWRLIKIARGYDLRQYAVDCLLGNKIKHSYVEHGAYSLYFYQKPTGTVFEQKEFEFPLNAEYKEYRYREGETIRPLNGKLEVVGYYISKG